MKEIKRVYELGLSPAEYKSMNQRGELSDNAVEMALEVAIQMMMAREGLVCDEIHQTPPRPYYTGLYYTLYFV